MTLSKTMTMMGTENMDWVMALQIGSCDFSLLWDLHFRVRAIPGRWRWCGGLIFAYYLIILTKPHTVDGYKSVWKDFLHRQTLNFL